MSNEKKERVMTPKGFLHKTTTKAAGSAAAFLAQYREWLTTGELAQVTSPILAKVDSKDLMPTPALEEIKMAVYNHMIVVEIRKGEDAMAKREAGSTAAPKNWTATIYDRNGSVCTKVNSKGEIEDLIKGFEKGQEADRWADLRLFDAAPDSYAVVQHATAVNRNGEPIATTILRGDAMARILKAPKGAVMRKTGGTTSSLSFRPTAKNDVSKFSHG